MIRPARKWRELQKLRASRRPQVRIDRCVLTAAGKNRYKLVVDGYGLRPGITPPQITVGGIGITEAKFDPSGRRITGVLAERPRSERLFIDLGYAQVENTVEMT